MRCTIIEDFFGERATDAVVLPEQLRRHLGECGECRSYHRFAAVLAVLKGSLETAPAELLPAVERRIIELTRQGSR